jgi:hypothetical protein
MIGILVVGVSIIAWPQAKNETIELKDAIKLIKLRNYSAARI